MKSPCLLCALSLGVLFAVAGEAGEARGQTGEDQGKLACSRDGEELRKIKKQQSGGLREDGWVRLPLGLPIRPIGEDEAHYYYCEPTVVSTDWQAAEAAKDEQNGEREIDATEVAATDETRRLRVERWTGNSEGGEWRQGFAVRNTKPGTRRGAPIEVVHSPLRGVDTGGLIRILPGKKERKTFEATEWIESRARSGAVKVGYGDVAVGDWDADGVADIVLAPHGAAPLSWRRLDGNGAGTVDIVPTPPNWTSRRVLAADLDGDGGDEIVLLRELPDVAVLREQRGSAMDEISVRIYRFDRTNNAWSEMSTVSVHPQWFADDGASGDFRGNKRNQDLVLGSSTRGVTQLVWSYDAENNSWTGERMPGGPEVEYGWVKNVAVAKGAAENGNDALIYGYAMPVGRGEDRSWMVGVNWAERTPDAHGGWTVKPVFRRKQRDPVTALAVSDLDGSGRNDDVLVGYRSGALEAWRRDEAQDRWLLVEGVGDWTMGCQVYRLAVHDWDGDGVAELMASAAGGNCERRGAFRVMSVRIVPTSERKGGQ